VDCFYEGENMLVIHPDECIDCAFASQNARLMQSSQTPSPASIFGSTSIANTQRFGPTSQRKSPAPPDADAFVNVPDKFAKYFSPNPGEGD
jgi:ferredoxin